jgi:hypothetical protein
MTQILKENEYLRNICENIIPKPKAYTYSLNQSPSKDYSSNSNSTSNLPDSEIYKRKYYHKRQETKVKDILYNTMSKAYMSPDDRKRIDKVERDPVVKNFF